MPRYKGKFGRRQAERLLWRAGFGPRKGEVDELAALDMRDAVRRFTRPPPATLVGPEPSDGDGRALAPRDAWGHDHLWWLDRMVRSNQPLVERMTLNWHDWFATGNVSSARFGLDQNDLLRRHALGRFDELLLDITADPAMLLWLSGTENTKWSPNENYARELMELFTLGAGVGYGEDDVREQARALTGWRNDWRDGVGPHNFRFDPNRHDTGVKRIFGQSGSFGWRDACWLCLEHQRHTEFFVRKLWSYFVPTEPSREALSALGAMYRQGGYATRPVVEAILMHPDFYEGPSMVKPPVVYIAGMLRALGRGIDTEAWTWIADLCGQRLFDPPNVAGWDESRWIDTATWRGRWLAIVYGVRDRAVDPDGEYREEDRAEALKRALKFWGDPSITAETRSELERFARRCDRAVDADWKERPYRIMRQNGLRMLIASAPDYQAC